jgi:hypothetical protein
VDAAPLVLDHRPAFVGDDRVPESGKRRSESDCQVSEYRLAVAMWPHWLQVIFFVTSFAVIMTPSERRFTRAPQIP